MLFRSLIFNEDDVCDQLMKGRTVESLRGMIVDSSVDLEKSAMFLEYVPPFVVENILEKDPKAVHHSFQRNWHMPESYKQLDIAEYILGLCANEEELQRCGHELLLYQERNLFNLLRYLKYLVDTMREHKLIWGVGRGSSVSSYVLYKIGVHRIDSMFYDLNVEEFLR